MPVAKQELKKLRISINYQYYKKLFHCIDMEQISHFARGGIEVCKLKYTNIHHQWDIENCKSLGIFVFDCSHTSMTNLITFI